MEGKNGKQSKLKSGNGDNFDSGTRNYYFTLTLKESVKYMHW